MFRFTLIFFLLPTICFGQYLKPTDNPSVNAYLIQADLEDDGSAFLGPGDWTINRPIVIDGSYEELRGSGQATVLKPTGDFEAVFLGKENDHCGVHDLWIKGGKHGIRIYDCNRVQLTGLWIGYTSSHAVYQERTQWICHLNHCNMIFCGGDAINAISKEDNPNLSHPATGNTLSVVNCNIEANKGCGINWGASGLNVNGCCIEGNDGPAIQISAIHSTAQSINISGSYFENDADGEGHLDKGEIHLLTRGRHRIKFMEIAGCNFSTRRVDENGKGGVILSCDTEMDGAVMRLAFRQSNRYGSRGVPLFRVGRSLQGCRIEHIPDVLNDMPYDLYGVNSMESSRRQAVMVHTFLVFCNQDRVDVEVPILQLGDNAVVLDITNDEYEAPNGETFSFKTEHRDGEIIARWTNTGGEVTRGKYRVRVTYSPSSGWEEDIPVPPIPLPPDSIPDPIRN